jgi:hypothetical protein
LLELLAGFAASLDPLFIIVPMAVEVAEFISRRLLGKANSFADEFFWLLISFLAVLVLLAAARSSCSERA